MKAENLQPLVHKGFGGGDKKMDETFAEQVFDELDSIGPEMTKEEILSRVESVQDLISDEFEWDLEGEGEDDIEIE